MVKWTLTCRHGVDCFRHYLDDFLTLGPPASVCHNNLQACIQLCSKVGLPVYPGKLEGPSTLLGSVMLQARLPAEKRKRFTLLSPLLVTSTMRASSPPRLERSPIA